MSSTGMIAASRCLHLLLAACLLSAVHCKQETVEGWLHVVTVPGGASEGPQLVLRLANSMAGAPGFKFIDVQSTREDILVDAISGFAPGARVAVVGELMNAGLSTGTWDSTASPYLLATSITLLDEPVSELGGSWTAAATRSAAVAEDSSGSSAAAPLKTLFLIVSTTCGGPRSLPAATREDLEAVLFDSGSAVGGSSTNAAGSSSSSSSSSAAATLQSYVAYCSNGRAALSRDTSRVLDGVVIPCAGPVSAATSQPVWLTSRCQTADMLGWGDAAVEAAKQQLASGELASYHHVVLVLPRDWRSPPSDGGGGGGGASFTASGEVGVPRRNADGSPAYSYSWLSGERYPLLFNYLHEMSHNLGLLHAGTLNGCEYCDATCVMGYCCDRLCPNAAHMAALGWADAVSGASAADPGQGSTDGSSAAAAAAAAAMGGALALEDLAEGLAVPYVLPAQHSAAASFVLIDAAAATGGIRYFLSYRAGTTNSTYDNTVGDAVHVHAQLTGAARRRYTDRGAWMDSVHAAALAAGGVWRDDATRLQVRAVAISGGEALVQLCRAPMLPAGAGAGAGDNATNWAACDGPAGGDGSSTSGAGAPGAGLAPSPAQGEPPSAGQTQTAALATQQNSEAPTSPTPPPPAPSPTPPPALPPPSPARQAAQAFLRNNGSPPPPPSPSPPAAPSAPSPPVPGSPGPGASDAAAERNSAAAKRKAKRASPPPPHSPSPSPSPSPSAGPAPAPASGGGKKRGKQASSSPPPPTATPSLSPSPSPSPSAKRRPNGSGRLRRLRGRAF